MDKVKVDQNRLLVNRNMPKLVLMGGFLGSGKTTLMVAIGKRMLSQGKNVALITNDQGEFLVDTKFAQSEGFSTNEVLYGCFCCRFPDFMNSISSAIEQSNPDYILAEPVGSCTDLLATVVTPLITYYKNKIKIAPLLVIVDAYRIVDEYSKMNLKQPEEPKEVLVSHQIREAQTILLSKIDLVDKVTLGKGKELISELNPNANIIEYSAKTGEGIEQILAYIIHEEAVFKKAIPLDYDIYARAEAEYGWYNGIWKVTSANRFNLFDFSTKLIKSFSNELFKREVAHTKLHLVSEVCSFKLSFVGGTIIPDGVCDPNSKAPSAIVTLNVRAKATPEEILSHVESKLKELSEELKVTIEDYKYSALVPPPPKPYYRMTESPEEGY